MLRKHEKGRQECLPHLHTRILNGTRIQKRANADWKVERTFLSAHIHQPETWEKDGAIYWITSVSIPSEGR